MRLGIAHHFGWAVAVTASADYRVVDRRRIELIEPGMAAAPIHHEGKALDDAAAAILVASTCSTPRTLRARAAGKLGARADEVLLGPRTTLGPPWAKDHRMALAATIVAG